MSSGVFPMKTQLTGGDRGNAQCRWHMQRGRLPAHGGQVILLPPQPVPGCSPEWLRSGSFSPVALLPVVWQCFCLGLGCGATEKKQSKVIHMPRLWSWRWWDCLSEKTDRPVRGLHWPMLHLKRRPVWIHRTKDCSGWKGPQEVSAPTSCSQQAQL